MTDIAANILGQVVTEPVKWVVEAIKRQFYYLCCFTTIITNLQNEAGKLDATTRDLQARVDRARDETRVITYTVEDWLKDSNDMKDQAEGILKEAPNVRSGCLNLGTRFSLSRRAKKTTRGLKKLRGQCKFDCDAIAMQRHPPAMEAVPIGTTYEFQSRKQIEEDIMKTLKDRDVNMMGICGMGGLGKTTMAKRIMNIALEEKIFDEVVMAVVSQPPVDKLKIQFAIGGSLGLSHLKDETSEARVAQKLHARLSGIKRTLLVLDDVWEKLLLENLGIPSNHKDCTILLTSRNGDVLRSMKVAKVFGMKVLSEDESWFLFKETTGTCVDNIELNSIAKDVVNECKGLPIALTTVGAALREEMVVRVWRHSLRQLTQVQPDIPHWISDVYNPLKLSYDFLESKQKLVFLLCCLFPEDYDVPIEHLTYFSLGLGIYEGGIASVDEARDWMFTLIKMLKNRSMLLDSDRKVHGDDYVRMHDVIRDVCIFIAKKEKCIGGYDCNWISSSHPSKFPTTSVPFPNLCLLFWIHKSSNEEFKLDNSFLEGVKDLSVLFIERLPFTSLPHTSHSLKNLKTLVLKSCKQLQILCGVGELANLEILNCHGCYLIEELPSEMKELSRLKLLDVTGCESIKRIGRGIISSLVGLEELKMLGSFDKWEAEDSEKRENTGLIELEVLTNLRCLEIHISDPALAGENFHLSSKLDRFRISCLSYFSNKKMVGLNNMNSFRSNRKLVLWMEKEINLGPWMIQLLRDTECLSLCGNGANNVDLAKIQKIRWLELGNCETTSKIVNRFSFIEHLDLYCLPKLETILDDDLISSNSFQNLKRLQLNCLPALKHIVMNCLPQLEVLSIRACQIMERVFLWKGESLEECNEMSQVITDDAKKGTRGGQNTLLQFPKLQKVQLDYLPKLVSFYESKCDVELPSLSEVKIYECYNMKSCTLGCLATPNLQIVRIHTYSGEHYFNDVRDLNGLLWKLYCKNPHI